MLLIALAGCAPRGDLTELIPDAARSADASTETIHVVTTRKALASAPYFGRERAEGRRFARFDVTVPKSRTLGQIQWRHKSPPDPARHFLTASHTPLKSRRDFARSLDRTPDDQDVVVFVHGFNTNFPEALYRLAQLSHDLKAPGRKVLFTWPSGGNPGGYLYDRDSALLARDALVRTLVDLDAMSSGRVTVVSFSMGGFLLVEALRQMTQAGEHRALRRLDGVVLVSPDIDVDLFRGQVRTINPLPRPFVIMASEEDRTLSLSAFLTGQPDRLGTVSSLAGLEDLGIVLIDVTRFTDDADTSHTTGLSSPSLLRILRSARGIDAIVKDENRRAQPGRSRRAGPNWLRRVLGPASGG